MAEFCEACNQELFRRPSDFKGLTSKEDWQRDTAVLVLCEGCGTIQVDPEGNCISKDCLKAGQPGHGVGLKGGKQMIKDAKDVTPISEFSKIMVVGDYGTGKSVFGSTHPTPGYVFDIDKHILIYRGLDFKYSQYPLTSKGWVDFEKDILEVAKKVEAGEIKTVILDSTTSMTDLAMERALQLDPKRNPATQGPLWNVHYQIVKNLVEGKLRKLISLNCNLLVNAHWRMTLDSDTGAVLSVDPMLTGMLSSIIPGYFDEVYYAFTKMDKGKPYYYLRTLPRGFYKARSCFSGKAQLLPAEIPNDYNVLMEYMNEKKKV